MHWMTTGINVRSTIAHISHEAACSTIAFFVLNTSWHCEQQHEQGAGEARESMSERER